jgi:hypothetical protein
MTDEWAVDRLDLPAYVERVLPVVLRERFGIVVDPEDLAAVLAVPGEQERS